MNESGGFFRKIPTLEVAFLLFLVGCFGSKTVKARGGWEMKIRVCAPSARHFIKIALAKICGGRNGIPPDNLEASIPPTSLPNPYPIKPKHWRPQIRNSRAWTFEAELRSNMVLSP
jgi:hypothetical protein